MGEDFSFKVAPVGAADPDTLGQYRYGCNDNKRKDGSPITTGEILFGAGGLVLGVGGTLLLTDSIGKLGGDINGIGGDIRSLQFSLQNGINNVAQLAQNDFLQATQLATKGVQGINGNLSLLNQNLTNAEGLLAKLPPPSVTENTTNITNNIHERNVNKSVIIDKERVRIGPTKVVVNKGQGNWRPEHAPKVALHAERQSSSYGHALRETPKVVSHVDLRGYVAARSSATSAQESCAVMGLSDRGGHHEGALKKVGSGARMTPGHVQSPHVEAAKIPMTKLRMGKIR